MWWLGSFLHVIKGYAYMKRSHYHHAESGEDGKSNIEWIKDLETFTSNSDHLNLDGVAVPELTNLGIRC